MHKITEIVLPQESLGSSQLATIFSCVLVVLVLTVLAPWFQPLPNSILAAIVLIALKGLIRQVNLRLFWFYLGLSLFFNDFSPFCGKEHIGY